MKFSTALIAAVAAIPGFVAGHIRMTTPLPYGGRNDFDLFPLDPTGANFPCAVDASKMVFPPDAPTLSVGQSSLTLQGSAVHGGGSCQVSITYDKVPTANSVFRVLKSFEGGCPMENGVQNLGGSQDLTLGFEIPAEVASGEAVLVWSWFNKVGNREMYMRCAPVNIKSSTTDKNAINDDAKFPIMFRANIGSAGQNCATPPTTDLIFPNPGPNLVGKGNAAPTGCNGSPPGGSGSGGAPSEKPVEKPVEDVRKPIAGDIGDDDNSEPVIQPPVVKPTPTEPAATPTPTPDTKPAPIKVPVEKKPVVSKPIADTKPAPVNPSPVAGGDSAQGGECEVNGQIYCNGESKFYICNFGKKVDMGSVAAGTKCAGGKIQKRNMVRFSSAHLRRRHAHGALKQF
jgi:hypothetical protein